MTANQINYWKNVETERHNQEQENAARFLNAETRRANLVQEAETHRANLAKEYENTRHNEALESLKGAEIAVKGINDAFSTVAKIFS